MSQHDDASFFRTFAMVLGALVMFTIVIAVIANLYSPDADRSRDPLVQQELARQIAPVGQSRVEAAAKPEITPVAISQTDNVDEVELVESEVEESSDVPEAVADSEDIGSDDNATESADSSEVETTSPEAGNTDSQTTPDTGEAGVAGVAEQADIPVRVKAVVATNCAGCHRDGLYGAQRNDDAEAWLALQSKGLDVLTASVINGKGAMLPRAETALSDEEISMAVQLMIAQATGADTAERANRQAESSTVTDSSDTSVAPEESDSSSPQAKAVEGTDESDASTTTNEPQGSDVAIDNDTAPADAVAAVEVPDNVKTVVDTLCAGCHVSGVADAPKLGDKSAWEPLLSMGMDKLLASAIAGKGAMPARGGSQLSDAELRLAIEYMVSK